MKNIVALLLPLMLFVASCGGDQPAAVNADPAKQMALTLQARIDSMRKALEDDTIYDRRGAQELLDVYKAYAKANPLDSLSPEYLFRAAGLSDPLGKPDESIVLYDRVIKDYPSWPRLVDCYYLKALTLDKMDKKGDARMAYEEVINKFPQHQFAADAKQMIENLQFTDEELIEKFRMQNDLQSQAEAAEAQSMSKEQQEAASKAAVDAKMKAKGLR